MHCPVCKDVTLIMADRQGIEVDYCLQCRGVWLDRGELDKLIERAALAMGTSERQTPQRDRGSGDYREHRAYDEDEYHWKKRKRGFLGELFDFD
jgi:Zn-finger nucleic acid-binding protein